MRITLPQHGFGTVEVDGVEIKSIRSISFYAAVSQINELHLTLIANEIEVEAEADVISAPIPSVAAAWPFPTPQESQTPRFAEGAERQYGHLRNPN